MALHIDIIIIFLSLIFGLLFFLVDFFEHLHPRLNVSIIAGVAISYFFLVLLPECLIGLPEELQPLMVDNIFILIGFCFIHVIEKIIIKKIEKKEYKGIEELLNLKKNLDDVDKRETELLVSELDHDRFDKDELKRLSKELIDLNRQELEIGLKINSMETEIEESMGRNLNEMRLISHYSYHFIIGLVMVFLLVEDFFFGVLFFLFAWIRAILTIEAEDTFLMKDLTIHIKFEHRGKEKLFLASAAITGVIISIILELTMEVNLQVVYILFSFISGVIFYTIVREIIPETEKGNTFYFIIGVTAFSLIIILFRVFITMQA